MSIDRNHVMGLSARLRRSYSARDSILYALAVGIGRDPLDPAELSFVRGGQPLILPTMMATLAREAGAATLRDSGIDLAKCLFAEQRVTVLAPLLPAATILMEARVTSVLDKGAGGAAVIRIACDLYDDETGMPIATAGITSFARDEGGFGGPRRDPTETPLPQTPGRAPDHVVSFQTRPDQALLYALTGDANPLHTDPGTALKAGFDRPILHGLCTFGIAGRALLQSICGYQPGRLLSIDARFSAPVMPGQTLATEIWNDRDGVTFQCRCVETGAPVLTNGRAGITAA